MSETLPIRTKADIAEAKRWLDRLGEVLPGRIGELVVKKRTRSSDQNALMWSRLEDMARQAEWHGVKLGKDDWKIVLLGGWLRERGEEMRVVPNWQGTGFEPLTHRTSRMAVDDMTAFLDFIEFAGTHLGVTFRERQAA